MHHKAFGGLAPPEPAGGAHSTPQTSLAEFRGEAQPRTGMEREGRMRNEGVKGHPILQGNHRHCTVVMSLCRAATGESWQLIMMECANKEIMCDPHSDNAGEKCGASIFAYPYFISFYIICSFLVRLHHLTMFIVCIIALSYSVVDPGFRSQ